MKIKSNIEDKVIFDFYRKMIYNMYIKREGNLPL